MQELKKRKTHDLRLTKFELVHLRDLFSVMMPPELKETLSQRLAVSQNRPMVEAKLWQKIARSCRQADIPMDDDAPDFIVSAAAPPPIGVFELLGDPEEAEQRDDGSASDEGSVFGDEGDDKEEEEE